MEPTLSSYKLSCELLGHSMDVRAVAVGGRADEGQTILSGSRDKSVKVWNKRGEQYYESLTYRDHKNFVACIYYMESEQLIFTGSNDATICIYKEGGYIPMLTLKGHESTVCSIAGGVEGKSIISGSWDRTARVWKLGSEDAALVLRGHEAAVWSVASLPADKKFITGSADKCIYYWNTAGEKLRLLKGHTDCVRYILALGSNSLVSCANDAVIRYWNDDGECIQEMAGHTNYIYALAQNKALGEHVIVSCGEDSTVRMWNLNTGEEMGKPLIHPAQSVWSITCLSNGDIVTGCSDGAVRVFTKDRARFANDVVLATYDVAVQARIDQMNEDLGGIKKTDLPGPEALLTQGTREGQTKMIRHVDGSVKCYSWDQGKWNLVGEVTGASGGSQTTSGKTLFEGKEYDFVFSVDISDTEPPIKLPYNLSEDPWHAAQTFIHRHNLPQVYLDQVANFIIKNSKGPGTTNNPAPIPSGFHDPFTGGSRYVPGSSNSRFSSTGNVDPFTGGSSYSTGGNQPSVDVNFTKGSGKHFPVNTYVTFDNCDPTKVLEKLKEFNNKLTKEKVSDTLLEAVIKLADPTPEFDKTAIEALQHLLHWPSDILFPVLDVTRLAVRNESIFSVLSSFNFLDTILPQMSTSVPNQLMIVRCLTNMMRHESGRKQIEMRLHALVEQINLIKTGSANLQIAIATFFLNITISQVLGTANKDFCRFATEGIVELLKWAIDLEACYRSMQAIGNLTTTPFGSDATAQIISVDHVMDKIRELTNTPQTGLYAKLNSAGNELLAAF